MANSKLDGLWYTRCGVPTAIGIAYQLGWLEQAFRADGIEVKSIRDSADQRVRDSHFDHFVTLGHPELHRSLNTDLREDWISAFEGYKDFLLKWGFIGQDVDVRAWIDPGPLEAARTRRGRTQAAE